MLDLGDNAEFGPGLVPAMDDGDVRSVPVTVRVEESGPPSWLIEPTILAEDKGWRLAFDGGGEEA
jgi:hypothetical protein